MANGKDRDRRLEARWRRIIRDHTRSGMTTREFCHKNNLAESAFYFWRRELQRRQAEQERCQASDPPAAPAFVAVHVAEHGGTPAGGSIEIELSGGRRIHVAAPVDRQALADVLAVLEGRPC